MIWRLLDDKAVSKYLKLAYTKLTVINVIQINKWYLINWIQIKMDSFFVLILSFGIIENLKGSDISWNHTISKEFSKNSLKSEIMNMYHNMAKVLATSLYSLGNIYLQHVVCGSKGKNIYLTGHYWHKLLNILMTNSLKPSISKEFSV